MKNSSKILLFFLITTLSFESCQSQQKHSQVNESSKSLKISFVGDLMNHTDVFEYARVTSDSFDFNPYFEIVKDEISSADFAIANLETVIFDEGRKPSGYPLFNAPINFLDALKFAGFDILALANNHITDYRKEGIIKTLQNINAKRMKSVGAYASLVSKDSVKIFKGNDISFALLNYTYDLNIHNLQTSDKYMVNILDSNVIKKDIQSAKNYKPDFIVIFYHFGDEYKTLPNSFQEKFVQISINSGADIIIGSHPHVLQPIEMIVDSTNNEVKKLVAYSLGNFLSNQRQKYTDAGGILSIYLSKNNDKAKIDSVEFIPTWVFKGIIDGKRTYRILPNQFLEMNSEKNFLSDNEKLKMKNSIQMNNEIIKKFSGNNKDYFKIR